MANQKDKIGPQLAAKLDKIQKRLEEDRDFAGRLEKDRDVLSELGFSPQEISTFTIIKPDTDRCSCFCGPNKGTGVGCHTRQGSTSDP